MKKYLFILHSLINSSIYNPNKKIECAIAFVIDADNVGVEKRTSEFQKNYKDVFTNLDKLIHNSTVIDEHFRKIGLYVFSNKDSFGKLEDIIFPIMRTDNESIFEAADNFFQQHFDKKRLKKPNNVEKTKSIIGITGQLQYSGASNRDIIKQTDYLRNDKIEIHGKCQEIVEFINKLRAETKK